MTEREFVKWVGDGWAEWVKGDVIGMPRVSFEHANLHAFLLSFFGGWVDDNELGKVLAVPFQIRFALEKSRRSPDIIFVNHRRMSLMRKQHFEGAPDLILEIISPDSQSRDRREKFLEYQTAGVKEYWIVDPLSEKVEAYALGKDRKFGSSS
jgi:Uma2 family endonuclease